MGSPAHLREAVTRRGDASSEVGRASPRVKRPPRRGGQAGHARTWPAPDSDGCRLLGAEPRGPAGRREPEAAAGPARPFWGPGDASPSGSRTVLNLQNRDEAASSGRPALPGPAARAARDGRFVSDSVPGSAGALNPHAVLRAPRSTAAGPDSPTAEKAGCPSPRAGKKPRKAAMWAGRSAASAAGRPLLQAARAELRAWSVRRGSPPAPRLRLPQERGRPRAEARCSRVPASRPHPKACEPAEASVEAAPPSV